MGLLEFSKLPVNTLVGADWKTFKTVVRGQHIAPQKRTKYILTKCICRLLSTCAGLQESKYRKELAGKPLEHDPLFILGHWRSGTTFLHNIFAQDKHFGYTTTYQPGTGEAQTSPDMAAVGGGQITVINQRKPTYSLPETGGVGTHLYTGAGVVLICIALSLLYKGCGNAQAYLSL